MGIANKARRLLINVGKMLPFAICGIVMLSYIETLYAMIAKHLLVFNDYAAYRKPISQLIGCYFEYDWVTIIVLTIIAFAIESCVWNKMVVLFLGLHLLFKHYISQIELYPSTIVVLCVINILISSYLTFKGIQILLKS